MLSYIAKRLIQGVIVLFFVSLLTFFVMYFMPGDPARQMVGQSYVTEEQLDAIRDRWGLNDPWYERYGTWIGNVVTGDFGTSMMRPGMPITTMIGDAGLMTLRLTALSFIISLVIAIPVGVIAAVKRYSWFDYGSMLGSTLGVAVPNYWIGLMAIVIFSVKLGWLPPYGSEGWKAYLLPVIVLSIEEVAALARITRGATLEVLSQDYVVTARAKGLAPRIILIRHVVRNTLLPVITIVGYRVAFILSGTIVVETVFAWPGLGRLFFQAITSQDLQVVQAIVLLLTAIVVIANILTDLTYAIIDPRVRIG
ncbi:MAG TPA: ABC transporter permease [Thermomicrobiales bacterium]|nr:ABC transporter permease [Thermomicrobiales bacterium]